MNNDFTSKIGLPPGTVVFTGKKRTEKITITITDYDEEQYITYDVESVERCILPENPAITRWIHVKGVHDVKISKALGKTLEFILLL